MSQSKEEALQRLVDKSEIHDVMCRYARSVDRGDWALLRSTYHPDAYDDHVGYKGTLEGLIEWLDQRFAGVDNSVHFLGNCLVEFATSDLALVETYFTSRRLRHPVGEECNGLAADDMLCRQTWGRYIDRFERRNGEWRVAKRKVVLDAGFTSVAKGGAKGNAAAPGLRNLSDALYSAHREIFGTVPRSNAVS
ncbi:hypothetical protein WL88_26125 [Burkholderia diffusa]|uniref:SnoaL-like domain-containing protein n=1 Tax=Burkholderia diffusa TaxID=488732 RepID=A0AAW3P9R1_9BURK|nr:nuclear transport factor 2 family protein [Burkholderia diffusa]KWF32816.1 hypothetical protein WL86_30170 [Burkholderia diffusa]KWF38740.1 hypothetical protein WL85_11310 [Burkholderia diffusa]KWF46785.1 hypothetical protein WL88_26125 [Burkholderia diffusa]KWF50645.1 hypothetical protein WL87_15795 [Burkholderia diffusa]